MLFQDRRVSGGLGPRKVTVLSGRSVDSDRDDVELAPQILEVEGYIARVEPLFEKSGFYKTEIARRVEHFGSIAHVWSTYESRRDPSDPEPFMRGINSIQLFNDGKHWCIFIDLSAARKHAAASARSNTSKRGRFVRMPVLFSLGNHQR